MIPVHWVGRSPARAGERAKDTAAMLLTSSFAAPKRPTYQNCVLRVEDQKTPKGAETLRFAKTHLQLPLQLQLEQNQF